MSLPVAIGSVINERYVVERVLGEGGMGVVVLAKHRVLNQRVAIKFLRHGPSPDQNAVQRFVREAQAAATLTSEYVARVHDVAVLPNGTPYIVMEYLEGATLAEILAGGPLPIRDATRFALQICEALAETHGLGIVHGDLKPENIYVAGAGDARRVKLLDFGVSKIAFEDPTSSAVVMGTPAYMAPEQVDHGSVTSRTDLFAFGAVLYEMLAGQPAFGTGTVDEVRARMQRGASPIGRPDLPPGFEDVIRLCLAVDPGRRVASALELAAALEPFMPAESSVQRINHITAPVAVLAETTARRHAATVVVSNRDRGYVAWFIAGFAALGVAGLVLVLMVFARRPSQVSTVAAVAGPVPSASVGPPPSAEPVVEPPSSSVPAPPPVESAAAASAKPAARPRAPTFNKPVAGDRFGTRK